MADMHVNRSRGRYSDDEINIIREHYPSGGAKKVQEFLPHRGIKGIAEKANSLGVKSNNAPKRFSKEEVETLRKYYPIGGYMEFQRFYPNRCQGSIHQKASQLGIVSEVGLYSTEEDRIIKEHYPQGGYEKVQKFLSNRDKASIQNRAKKLKVKYLEYNKDYFEEINSEDKAYWLGFLYADGYVTTGNRWGVSLSSLDIEHLKKFLVCFESNARIRVRDRVSKFEIYTSYAEECSLMFNNKKTYDDLVDKGVVRNKTNHLQFPKPEQVPNHLMSHFVRGFFDGDGSYVFYPYDQVRVDRNNKKYKRIYKDISLVCKSEGFVKGLRAHLLENDIELNLNYSKETDLHTLRTSNSKNLLKFIEYVYEDSDTKLDRKYEKAQEIKEYCLSH